MTGVPAQGPRFEQPLAQVPVVVDVRPLADPEATVSQLHADAIAAGLRAVDAYLDAKRNGDPSPLAPELDPGYVAAAAAWERWDRLSPVRSGFLQTEE